MPAAFEASTDIGIRTVRINGIRTLDGLQALEAVAETATASPRMGAIIFGAADLSAELGISMDWKALLYGRTRMVHFAALAGLEVIDVPYLDLDDVAGHRAEAERSCRLGFTGNAAIHLYQHRSSTKRFRRRRKRLPMRAAPPLPSLKQPTGFACLMASL